MNPLLNILLVFTFVAPGFSEVPSCQNEAHKIIEFRSTHTFYIADCKFVTVHYDKYEARNLRISIFHEDDLIERFDLQETNGLMADFATPVFTFANKTDGNSSDYHLSRSNIGQFAPELGYFSLYRDPSKMAAMVYSYRSPLDFSLEGNIGSHILRRLPGAWDMKQYILMKLLDAYQAFPDAKHYPESPFDDKFNLAATHLTSVPIKFLVVHDQPGSRQTDSERMKRILMYYNFIDMLYCNFRSPVIKIVITGIVFLQSKSDSLYLKDISPNSEYLTTNGIHSIERFIRRKTRYLQLNSFDIISVMTQRLVVLKTYPLQVSQAIIVHERKVCEHSNDPTMIVALSVDYQAGHGIFLSQLLAMFGDDHFMDDLKNECNNYMINVQADNLNLMTLWPKCVTKIYSRYFRTHFCAHYAGE